MNNSTPKGDSPNDAVTLPQLRREKRVDVPRLIGIFRPGVAEVNSQVEPYAQAWDRHNAAAANSSGPLLCVYGDSASQGVGGSSWKRSWVLPIRDLLREATGEPWRVVNLSMSGGRFRDVVDRQIPAFNNNLPPADLTVAIVGTNDLIWRRNIDAIVADASDFADALPERSVVSLVGERRGRAAQVNEAIQSVSEQRGHTVFGVWRWKPPLKDTIAEDNFHPSDNGYHQMRDRVWDAVCEHLDLGSPELRSEE